MSRAPTPVRSVLLTLALAPPGIASPCDCLPPASVLEERERSTVVFVGKVEDLDVSRHASGGNALRGAGRWLRELFGLADPPPRDQHRMYVTFEVDETFKGSAVPRLRIATPLHAGTCGYGFEPGAVYLVYAGGDQDLPSVSACSRTAKVADAAEDLAVMRSQ